jgi:hypothetical protein
MKRPGTLRDFIREGRTFSFEHEVEAWKRGHSRTRSSGKSVTVPTAAKGRDHGRK